VSSADARRQVPSAERQPTDYILRGAWSPTGRPVKVSRAGKEGASRPVRLSFAHGRAYCPRLEDSINLHKHQRPWVQRYEPGVGPEVQPPDGAFHELWDAAAAASPGRPALWASNRTLQYSELEALVARATAAMARDGVGPGRSVLVAVPPGVHYVVTVLALLRAGGVALPLDPALDPEDVVAAASDVAPAVSVASTEHVRALAAAGLAAKGKVVEARELDAAPRLLRLLARAAHPRGALAGPPSGSVRWSQWMAPRVGEGRPVVGPADEALLVPGADGGRDLVFRHGELAAGALQIAGWLTDAQPDGETWLHLLGAGSPALVVALLGAAFLHRARTALVASADGEDVVEAVRYLRPAYVFSSASQATSLLGVRHLLSSDLGSVRAWIVSDPMPSGLARQFEESSGLEPCQGLALPCAAGLVACNPINGHRARGSVGLPMPSVDVRIDGEAGGRAAPGQLGNLVLRGPNCAPAGRWRPTGVRAKWDQSGWLHVRADGRAAK
jgi:long-chain acyl-CoA synthetase